MCLLIECFCFILVEFLSVHAVALCNKLKYRIVIKSCSVAVSCIRYFLKTTAVPLKYLQFWDNLQGISTTSHRQLIGIQGNSKTDKKKNYAHLFFTFLLEIGFLRK